MHAHRWYFWNEITGETQWEDPGGASRHIMLCLLVAGVLPHRCFFCLVQMEERNLGFCARRSCNASSPPVACTRRCAVRGCGGQPLLADAEWRPPRLRSECEYVLLFEYGPGRFVCVLILCKCIATPQIIWDPFLALIMQAHRYSWVENWSEEHQRPFYYNQKTKESKWEKPVDLAWRRVKPSQKPQDEL